MIVYEFIEAEEGYGVFYARITIDGECQTLYLSDQRPQALVEYQLLTQKY
jgi:hypothetical protein